jgi:hypothetical protein
VKRINDWRWLLPPIANSWLLVGEDVVGDDWVTEASTSGLTAIVALAALDPRGMPMVSALALKQRTMNSTPKHLAMLFFAMFREGLIDVVMCDVSS